jgi:hypothetical protein
MCLLDWITHYHPVSLSGTDGRHLLFCQEGNIMGIAVASNSVSVLSMDTVHSVRIRMYP